MKDPMPSEERSRVAGLETRLGDCEDALATVEAAYDRVEGLREAAQAIADKVPRTPYFGAEWDAFDAALASTQRPDEGGTTTDCPLTGVHEHAFRGPHRFREWEPGEDETPPRLCEDIAAPYAADRKERGVL